MFTQQQQKAPEEVRESSVIGKPTPRIDGPLKTTGSAMYSSDHNFPGLVYAWPTTATIASGTVQQIDTAAAQKMPGVLAVYTHENLDKLYRVPPASGFSMIIDEHRPALEDNVVRYWGQYVAVAVAETLEQARAAAEAVKVTYAKTPHNTAEALLAAPNREAPKKPQPEDPKTAKPAEGKAKQVTKRGDTGAALQAAAVKHDAVYSTPPETHNPIELHASVAVYDNGRFTLYETSQAVMNHRDVMAATLGVPPDRVQVITRYLGSGFGGKLWPWPHAGLAAACARSLNRPVKLVVSRSMMFESVGHRPPIDQRIQLAADSSGKLTAIQHDYANHTSIEDDYDEGCGEATGLLYSCPNVLATSSLVRRNVGTPTSMRGPGAVPGLFALESAMDELAIKLKMDPIKLRQMNEPEVDETDGKPFSSRHLQECLSVGAEKFGWAKRNPVVGSMKNSSGQTLGWGVAACTWGAMKMDAEVTVEIRSDGTARVATGSQDVGTGTYTVLAQLVAHETGVPVDKVEVVLGDSSLPAGPISGGSWATASLVPAALNAAKNATKSVLNIATQTDGSPFKGRKQEELECADGIIRVKGQPSPSLSASQALSLARVRAVNANAKSQGLFGDSNSKFSFHSYGAQFAEVTWEPEIARLRVSRIVTVIDAGRMINPRAARNQIEGAVVMGVGMAMLEATEYDQRFGAPINNNLADYIVAVHADCPAIDVTFLDHPDFNLNEVGARGVGEIGLAGVAPAITNAVYHATGFRARKLPVRIEDLIA
ncbi:xanthine dehydrogenase family protein molybdopterin-binding subunit [Terriglobus aquaticus]|uniref:Xanthine dehydrogenase family protein molybdopterin-binding subunit n=1 Tax=Terriglobus aquaticus TaxID=940139 RepID=A0ABW9KGR5_9BACT|nr:xanthine dehydrogenase family protein molybdopterin-binding subunit [Terriglobus aquaticus]